MQGCGASVSSHRVLMPIYVESGAELGTVGHDSAADVPHAQVRCIEGHKVHHACVLIVAHMILDPVKRLHLRVG